MNILRDWLAVAQPNIFRVYACSFQSFTNDAERFSGEVL
jgi:hypothetical protein